MPGDVAVTPTGSRPDAVFTRLQSTPAVSAAAKASDTATSDRPLINPSFHVDLALNLVVLQFVDDKGDVTNSIPSEKQLKAYREQAAAAPIAGQADRVR